MPCRSGNVGKNAVENTFIHERDTAVQQCDETVEFTRECDVNPSGGPKSARNAQQVAGELGFSAAARRFDQPDGQDSAQPCHLYRGDVDLSHRHSLHRGQLRHALASEGTCVARRQAALEHTFHPDLQLVAEPGRALLRPDQDGERKKASLPYSH